MRITFYGAFLLLLRLAGPFPIHFNIYFFQIHLVFHERKIPIGLDRHEGEQLLPE